MAIRWTLTWVMLAIIMSALLTVWLCATPSQQSYWAINKNAGIERQIIMEEPLGIYLQRVIDYQTGMIIYIGYTGTHISGISAIQLNHK